MASDVKQSRSGRCERRQRERNLAGLGNLIIGGDEMGPATNASTPHNLIVGANRGFTAGGLLAGCSESG